MKTGDVSFLMRVKLTILCFFFYVLQSFGRVKNSYISTVLEN